MFSTYMKNVGTVESILGSVPWHGGFELLTYPKIKMLKHSDSFKKKRN